MANPTDSSVYYQLTYWNDYEEVVRHLNRRAFDDPDGTWWDFVARYFGNPKRLGLSFNCGTGWVERDLLDAGAVQHIVAVDYLQDLLDAGAEVSAPYSIEYHQLDTNTAEFPVRDYDLVVNHAAGHHVAHIDRVVRRLWELLAHDGHLVMYDYTGPHRNQYPERIWEAAMACNASLPTEFRSEMNYPHFATMMASDPTEAIHSELVLETTARYFRFEHFRRLGGPIAYLLLTHNRPLQTAPAAVRAELVEQVLAADVAHVERFPQDSLFTFAICSPRSPDEFDRAQLEAWTFAEEDREAAAQQHTGRYYLPTALEPAAESVAEPVVEEPVEAPVTPYSVALHGPRFVSAALVRSLAIRFPAALPVLRSVRRLLGRFRRAR